MNASSLSSYIGDITNEIRSSNDGIAVLLGPQTAAESKLNQKQSILLRNQVLHANGVDSTTRLLIALVSKYMPQHIAPEYLFPIDCKEIPIFENSKKIRNVILEFEAAFVKYLGENIEKVEKIIKTVIEKYKESPDIEISSESKNIYIMFLALKLRASLKTPFEKKQLCTTSILSTSLGVRKHAFGRFPCSCHTYLLFL